MEKIKRFITVRRLSQFGFLAFVSWLALSHQWYGVEKAASIDAFCPFGGLETFLTYFTTGEFLKRTFWSSLILLGITIVVTLVFGRIFCSHICPLGTLQEWLRNIARKLGFKKELEMPVTMDKYARYFKYIVLLIIIYFSYQLGDLVFRNYDPYVALMHFGEEFDEKIVGYSILGIVLLMALFTKNIWCRYFCPLGAFLGIIKKISPFKIHREASSCTNCGLCRKTCPANLPVGQQDVTSDADCTSCLNCVADCPTASLSISIIGKKFNKKWFSLIALAVFIIPVIIVTNTPAWKTGPVTNLVKPSGEIDVANIRGSNTLGNLIETTGIPMEVFTRELGVPSDADRNLKLKEIGTKFGLKNKAGEPLETEDFREVVSRYLKSSK